MGSSTPWAKALHHYLDTGELLPFTPLTKGGTNNMKIGSALLEAAQSGDWNGPRLKFLLFDLPDDDIRSAVYCPQQLAGHGLLMEHASPARAALAEAWLGEWLWLIGHVANAGGIVPGCRMDVGGDDDQAGADKVMTAYAALTEGKRPRGNSRAPDRSHARYLARLRGVGLTAKPRKPNATPLLKLATPVVMVQGHLRALYVRKVDCIDTPVAAVTVPKGSPGRVYRQPARATGFKPGEKDWAYARGEVGCGLSASLDAIRPWSNCQYINGKGATDGRRMEAWQAPIGRISGGWEWGETFREFGPEGPGGGP